MNEKYPHKELTEKIIGAAFKVHNTLGSGFVEKVYENALVVELKEQGIDARVQKPVRVTYQGENVGEFLTDMVVEDKVLVEVKAVRSITREFEAKLINYLKATGIEVGLLINFSISVQIKRKVYSKASANKSASQSA